MQKDTPLNRLAQQKSPYLLQHSTNPVDWYPWSAEAFAAAKTLQRPIFLSIGYSTCYWCHVMEKDSFEKQDVAELLNRDFICIKLDREERPDLDQLYMDALLAMRGQGGWPMSVFLTHDARPFWAGTFFYREQFKSILSQIAGLWQDNQVGIEESASALYHHLSDGARSVFSESEVANRRAIPQLCQAALATWRQRFDSENGGFSQAPKFPPHVQLSFLLRAEAALQLPEAGEMLRATLRHMARGGIYDQLSGGFARYSVDERWIVPHFEKMLYDNAQLARVYLEAHALEPDDCFLEVATQTLAFVCTELRCAEGGFCAALDAGDVGAEGAYYVYSDQELAMLFSEHEKSLLGSLFDLAKGGNFEHGAHVLTLAEQAPWSLRNEPELRALRGTLEAFRAQRKRPALDTKVLCAWNGLLLTSFCTAARVTSEQQWLEEAQRLGADLLRIFAAGPVLQHRACGADVAIDAFLDDYAYLIEGLLALYQTDFDTTWLHRSLY
jgi:uncharacterized protein YyaL (SSP411 family)